MREATWTRLQVCKYSAVRASGAHFVAYSAGYLFDAKLGMKKKKTSRTQCDHEKDFFTVKNEIFRRMIKTPWSYNFEFAKSKSDIKFYIFMVADPEWEPKFENYLDLKNTGN